MIAQFVAAHRYTGRHRKGVALGSAAQRFPEATAWAAFRDQMDALRRSRAAA